MKVKENANIWVVLTFVFFVISGNVLFLGCEKKPKVTSKDRKNVMSYSALKLGRYDGKTITGTVIAMGYPERAKYSKRFLYAGEVYIMVIFDFYRSEDVNLVIPKSLLNKVESVRERGRIKFTGKVRSGSGGYADKPVIVAEEIEVLR